LMSSAAIGLVGEVVKPTARTIVDIDKLLVNERSVCSRMPKRRVLLR
jgi:hypothetical protein